MKVLVHSRTYGDDLNSLQIDLHSKCNSNKNKAWGVDTWQADPKILQKSKEQRILQTLEQFHMN